MIIKIEFSNNVSITFQVEKVINQDRLLLSSFPEASFRLKTGLPCTLYLKNGTGYQPIRQSAIRSVEEAEKGVIVNV